MVQIWMYLDEGNHVKNIIVLQVLQVLDGVVEDVGVILMVVMMMLNDRA